MSAKIKNISSKIINIGKDRLMPDMEISVADSIANAGAVTALVRLHLLSVSKEAAAEEKKAATAASKPKKAKAESAKAEEPATVTKAVNA